MTVTASIFLDLNLPNPATWFYFSGLLAVALFFKFSRLFSMRNLDVLTLYLGVPGLLLLTQAQEAVAPADRQAYSFYGYLALLLASLYFLARCLLDLALLRRPALAANLNVGGLFWLAGALVVSLIAVAVPKDAAQPPRDDTSPASTDPVKQLAVKAIQPTTSAGLPPSGARVWAERGLALLCHLSVVVGLILIGWRHFDDVQAGVSAATFYLLLPYTFLLAPGSPAGVGRWDHAWPMAFFVWTIFTYRRPLLAGAFLGVAAGSAVYLVVALPAWLSFYRGKGAGRFLVSFLFSAGLALAVLGGLLWLNGELSAGGTRFDWQPWKRPATETPGFWQELPGDGLARYRVPIFIAAMALVLVAGFWPNPKNLAHVIALSAAALISIQFWYADRGGVYVLWYLPLLLLLAFRPNLAAAVPPPPAGQSWVARLAAAAGRFVLRFVRPPTSRPVSAR